MGSHDATFKSASHGTGIVSKRRHHRLHRCHCDNSLLLCVCFIIADAGAAMRMKVIEALLFHARASYPLWRPCSMFHGAAAAAAGKWGIAYEKHST